MKIRKEYIKLVLPVTLLLVSVCANDVFAQIELPDDDVEDVTAPIDGFIGVALAIGSYFGLRKLRRK